jgi:hypothetical protein
MSAVPPAYASFPVPHLTIMEGKKAVDAGIPYRSNPYSQDTLAFSLWRKGWRDALVKRVQIEADELMDAHGHRATGKTMSRTLGQNVAGKRFGERIWLAVAHEVMATQVLFLKNKYAKTVAVLQPLCTVYNCTSNMRCFNGLLNYIHEIVSTIYPNYYSPYPW